MSHDPQPPSKTASSSAGEAIGCLGFFVGMIPAFFILHHLIAFRWYASLLNSPPEGLRTLPMGFSSATIAASFVSGVVCPPIAMACAGIARRLGSLPGEVMAKLGVLLFLLSAAIGTAGFLLLCLIDTLRLAE